MTRRVFVHLGLPKTGTSYLQGLLWSHRPELRAAGLLLPGRERRDHLWSSLAVREDPSLARRGPRAVEAWPTVLEEVGGWTGDVLVSHEFLASASQEQAAAMVEALAEAGGGERREVHLVATAREPLSLFTSSWQEHLKNKGTRPLADYSRQESVDPTVVWNWRALDLGLVLQRWGAVVPPDRVHVITPPPPDRPRHELWERLCGVLGVDPGIAGPGCVDNATMGVVQAETLRRLNPRLGAFSSAFDRGVWIRSYLADDRLVPQGGERYWPDAAQVADARRRGEAAVALVRERGFHVVGDLESLLVPADLPQRRHPDSVTDAEVAAVALDLVADLLVEVRELTDRTGAPSSREPGRPAEPRPTRRRGVRRVASGLAARLRRPGPRAAPTPRGGR